MVVYRCKSADYVQRFEHHAIDIRAEVAVRCKIAYCPMEGVKMFIHYDALLYDRIVFFVLQYKGKFYKNAYFFSNLWHSAVRSSEPPQNPPNQRNRFYIWGPHHGKIVAFKRRF
jgi:hypothetical protein